MILTSTAENQPGISCSAGVPFFTTSVSSTVTSAGSKKPNPSHPATEEDALLCQSSPLITNNTANITAEMVRRRLPSLPPPSTAETSQLQLQQQYYSLDHITSAFNPNATTTQSPLSSSSTTTAQPPIQYYSGTIPTSSTSQTPIYYTSCAPETKDVAVNGGSVTAPKTHIRFDSSTCASSVLSPVVRFLPDKQQRPLGSPKPESLFNPPSQTHHPVDPAILPGAPFRPAPQSTRAPQQFQQQQQQPQQKLLSSVHPKPSAATTKANSDTISQLRFKKELRETLAKRRLAIEACEIEANHRQYMVNRMLNSGLMPASLRLLPISMAELECIPRVTKCQLPAELIKGARVVPSRFKSAASQSKTEERGGFSQSGYGAQTEQKKKSVGCQCEKVQRDFFSLPTTSIGYYPSLRSTAALPSTSLKMQLKAAESTNRRLVDEETQTSMHIPTPPANTHQRPLVMAGSSYQHLSPVCQDKNYLRATSKQLVDTKRRFKHLFTDTHNLEDIERKRREIELELEWRKHRLSSMMDLRQLREPQQGDFRALPHPSSSDYSSTVPHYGSLPRIDYPTGHIDNIYSTYAQPVGSSESHNLPASYGYGSLPRNYERFLGGQGDGLLAEDPYRVGVRSQMPDARALYPTTRSMHDLNDQDWLNLSQRLDPRLRLAPTPRVQSRSLNYLDQSLMDEEEIGVLRQQLAANQQQQRRLYSSDTTNPSQVPMASAPSTNQNENLLSQYANYLNNQFLLGQQQQQRQEEDLGLEAGPLPTQGYIGQTHQQDSSSTSSRFEEELMKIANAEMELEDKRQRLLQAVNDAPEPMQDYLPWQRQALDNYPPVYSRNETNYGSRPFGSDIGDYGNYLRNRAQSLRQLDRLQDLVNHNNQLYSGLVDPTLGGPYSTMPNRYFSSTPGPLGQAYGAGSEQMYHQQPRRANYSPYDPGSWPQDNNPDGLSRMMQQYSRNTSANFPSRGWMKQQPQQPMGYKYSPEGMGKQQLRGGGNLRPSEPFASSHPGYCAYPTLPPANNNPERFGLDFSYPFVDGR